MSRYRVACDAGGTMTDVIVVDEEGRSVIGKAPTSPHDESIEFLPDLDAFYRDRLARPLPDDVEYVDKTLDVVKSRGE